MAEAMKSLQLVPSACIVYRFDQNKTTDPGRSASASLEALLDVSATLRHKPPVFHLTSDSAPLGATANSLLARIEARNNLRPTVLNLRCLYFMSTT